MTVDELLQPILNTTAPLQLTEAGVGTLIHYPVPPHVAGAYAQPSWPCGSFLLAEPIATTILSLPLGPHVTEEQVAYVVHMLREFGAVAK